MTLSRGGQKADLPPAIVTLEPVSELLRHPDTHKLKRFCHLANEIRPVCEISGSVSLTVD
jgi:hypothetical protein